MSWLLNVLPVTLYFSTASSAIRQTSTGRPRKNRTGRKIRSQLWETITGWFLIKEADLRCTCMYVGVCVCGCVLNFNIFSFPQVQYLLAMWGSCEKVIQQKSTYMVILKYSMIRGSYSTSCTGGSVCCHCVNVSSLSSRAYSHLFWSFTPRQSRVVPLKQHLGNRWKGKALLHPEKWTHLVTHTHLTHLLVWINFTLTVVDCAS